MARWQSWLQRGDSITRIRPGLGEAIKIVGYALHGSAGNDATFRFVTGELTAIAIGTAGADYTAAGTKAYAVGDGKRVELGAVTVNGTGGITAIAIPTFTHGFLTAPTIVIEGDGDGNAVATATVTRRVQTVQSTTGMQRNGVQFYLTRDVWAEIEADSGTDWAFASGEILP